MLPSPKSTLIDAGEVIPGHHCAEEGPNPTGCVEWFGQAPDIGACEYVPTNLNPPSGLTGEVKW